MKKTFLLLALLTVFYNFGQVLKKPAPGKCIVYFTRSGFTGSAINFRYYDGENYLGKFNSGKFLIYECDPGEHLFWAKSENFDFVEANLEADKIYIIQSEAKMGALKAGVSLEPFSKSDEKYEKNKAKLIKFIETKTRYYLNELDIPGEVEKNKELCAKYLEKYKEKKQKPGEIKILTPDMNIEE